VGKLANGRIGGIDVLGHRHPMKRKVFPFDISRLLISNLIDFIGFRQKKKIFFSGPTVTG